MTDCVILGLVAGIVAVVSNVTATYLAVITLKAVHKENNEVAKH